MTVIEETSNGTSFDVPAPVTTWRGEEPEAPVGTIALIEESPQSTQVRASVAPKKTFAAPRTVPKPLPLTVTQVPGWAAVGLTPVTVALAAPASGSPGSASCAPGPESGRPPASCPLPTSSRPLASAPPSWTFPLEHPSAATPVTSTATPSAADWMNVRRSISGESVAGAVFSRCEDLDMALSGEGVRGR